MLVGTIQEIFLTQDVIFEAEFFVVTYIYKYMYDQVNISVSQYYFFVQRFNINVLYKK